MKTREGVIKLLNEELPKYSRYFGDSDILNRIVNIPIISKQIADKIFEDKETRDARE